MKTVIFMFLTCASLGGVASQYYSNQQSENYNIFFPTSNAARIQRRLQQRDAVSINGGQYPVSQFRNSQAYPTFLTQQPVNNPYYPVQPFEGPNNQYQQQQFAFTNDGQSQLSFGPNNRHFGRNQAQRALYKRQSNQDERRHSNPNRRHKDKQHWNRPHRPHHMRYRDFANVYKEIHRRAEMDNPNIAIADDGNDDDDDDDDDFNGRSIVTPGQYPHMAAIGFKSMGQKPSFKCGGSLISEIFVLTAAHCCYLNGETPHIVKIGDIKLTEREAETEPQRRRIYQIYVHPYYDASLYYNDIALIQLNRPVDFTHFVRPIRLWSNEEIPYEKVFTMGYGSTSFAQAPTNILTELDLSIVPWTTCNSTMPHDESAPMGILESQICAKDYEKNRDTCQGDSGGPLQLNLERKRKRNRNKRPRYYLVGITSYGAFCRSQYPGIYTRVSSYVDWIASIVWPEYFQNFQ